MTDSSLEDKALKLSIVGAAAMAALGIGFALFTRSEIGSAPLPYSVIRGNLRELLMGAPTPAIQKEIHSRIARATKDLPIDETIIRLNKMGRSLYLHLYLLVADSHHNAPVKDLDTVRAKIITELSEAFPDLTIDVIFTTNRKYTHL